MLRFLTAITRCLLPLSLIFGTEVFAVPTTPLFKILAFGDSLTAGYHLAKESAYPAQLQKILKDKAWNVEVINAGVSGDTSSEGLRRVDWNLKSGPFDLVILELGANDGLRHLPLTELKKNLEGIVTRFQKSGAEILLLGMKLPLNLDASYRKDFEAVFSNLARQKKLSFLPFMLEGVAAHELLNLDDQMHPNESGQVIVAHNVARSVEPLLKKLTQKPTVRSGVPLPSERSLQP